MTNAQNEQALNTLVRAITLSQGQFSLILVRCNYTALREQTLEQLRSQCPIAIRELVLAESSPTLYTAIKTELGEQYPEALMVLGLENVGDLETILTSTNQVREEFRKEFSFPLVLWITNGILQKLIKLVPDLESWSTTVELVLLSEDLLTFLGQTTDDVFAQVMEAGAGRFVDSASLGLGEGSTRRYELESALQELKERKVALEPELNASLEFVLGQNSQLSMAESWKHYEHSLQIWHQHPNLERQGCLLFYMGLWWRRYAVLHRAEYTAACSKAKEFFRQCVESFEQANRFDLSAKFINAWGEVLTRLEGIEELEAVAQRAVPLLQQYSEPIWIAYGYGLQSEVALRQKNWSEAKRYAELALTTNDQTAKDSQNDWSWERNHYRNLYEMLLAKSERQMGQVAEAIARLESAQANGNPQHDPTLYIQILEELRSLYFDQKQYLKAFDAKQAQQAVEQQYGFRAFIGAGRLQPSKSVSNPALVKADDKGTVAQEISASGRQQDVNRLVGRIARDDQKLIVLHGQSGVGKSSILQAGLIPALDPIMLGARDVVTVLQQVYSNWNRELGQGLLRSLQGFKKLELPENTDSVPSILQHLRVGVDHNLLIVLIFDQFEEFFFVYKDPSDRKLFYEFLRDCLNIPFVKVILSLREDYLHYLLECNERLISLDVVNNNILDKNILAYLGNFPPNDAKAVIQALTKQSQFAMQPDLVDELVRDLAEDLGEVRPIELQVVGTQLQAEAITSLEKYKERGPKERFVERFLEEVVKDCGAEHEQIAKLVLYLLTDENLTRPLKTRGDLEMELDFAKEKLDLVLEVLVKSRLVFLIPAVPTDRYQLVHDYLVVFVRQQQSARLIAEIEKEREQRKLTEARLNKVLTQQLRTARRAAWTFGGLMVAVTTGAIIATVFAVHNSITSMTAISAQNNNLDRLVSAVKAGKQYKKFSFAAIIPDTRLRAVAELNQAVYGVKESTRLEGHTQTVTQVIFSPNGQLIATASDDKKAGLWLRDGTRLKFLEGHTQKVTVVSFSPDSKILATGSADNTVRLWKSDGTPLNVILRGHKKPITSVAFSRDGKNIATASEDNMVMTWSLDGKFLKAYDYKAAVTLVKYSSDSQWLAVAGVKSETLKLWRVNGSEIPKTIDNYGTLAMNFSADDKDLIFLNKDRSIKYRALLDGKLLYNSSSYPCGNNKLGVANLNSNGRKVAYVNQSSFNESIGIQKSDDFIPCRSTNQQLLHPGRINYLSFSPDDKLLASASTDRTVKLWNIDTSIEDRQRGGQLLISPDGISKVVNRSSETELINPKHPAGKLLTGSRQVLNFSPNSQMLVTDSSEAVIELWSARGQYVQLPDQQISVEGVYVSPEGERVLTIAANNTVKLWNRDGFLLKQLTKQDKSFIDVSFSPDGNVIALIEKERVDLWSRDGTYIKTLSGHLNGITKVIFSPDSRFLASIGGDTLINLYRTDGILIKTLSGHTNVVRDVSFSPNSQWLVSTSNESYRPGSSRSTIKRWLSQDGTLVKTILGFDFSGVTFISPDGSVIIPSNFDNTNGANNIEVPQILSLDGITKATLEGHNDSVTSFSHSPNGQILTTGSRDQTIRLWNNEGTRIRTLPQQSNTITSLDFSPNGQTFVSADADNTVKLWSADGQELRTLQELKKVDEQKTDDLGWSKSNKVKFSTDGKLITFVSNPSKQGTTIKVWSNDGKELKSSVVKNNAESSNYPNPTNFSFSLDQDTVAIAHPKNDLKLWNLDGKLLATLRGHKASINSASFSPNNTMLASASDDKTVKLWRNDGTLMHTLQHKDKVNTVIFNPHGEVIASASDDTTVKLWRNDGKLLHTLQHKGKVNTVSFSRDGILASGDDKTVRLWDKNGNEIGTPLNHGDEVNKVRFSPDGKTLASTSTDGSVKVWNISMRQEITRTKGSPYGVLDLEFSPNSQILAMDSGGENQLFFPNLWFKDTSFTSSFYASDFQFTPDGKAIAVAQGDEVKYLSLDLDTLLSEGCDKLRSYLKTNPNVNEGDRLLCDGISSQQPNQP